MRRLRALLAGLLSVWLPIDAAVAGWWHHHHHALPPAYGPLPMAPCGGPPAPWAGWEHAVIIDDRPLFAPAPVFVAAPVIEVVTSETVVAESASWETGSWETVSYESGPVESVIVGDVVAGSVDTLDGCACSACGEGTITDEIEGVPVDEGMPIESVTPTDAGEVIGSARTLDSGARTGSVLTDIDAAAGSESVPAPQASPVEDTPERTPPLTLPSEPAPTTPAPAVTAEKPADDAPESVLEPRESVTLQGEAAAPIDEPAGEPIDDMEGFEAPADDDATDEPMDDGDAADDQWEDADVVKEPAAPGEGSPRNLFDEAPADEAPAADDFGAPADGDGAIPDAPPMEEGFEPPADEAPLDDVPADDMPMEEAPADEGFEAPADDAADEPMDDGADDAQSEEAPADEEPAADPFDSSRIRVPSEPTRLWQDDTGRFSTEGRLVEIGAGSVRILKVTGRHTTVPMDRLSAADRAHVAGVRQGLAAARPASDDTAGIR